MQVSNMVSLAYLPPFNRKPTKEDFLEMGKSLVHVYPCLNDSEKKHVSMFSNFLKGAHIRSESVYLTKTMIILQILHTRAHTHMHTHMHTDTHTHTHRERHRHTDTQTHRQTHTHTHTHTQTHTHTHTDTHTHTHKPLCSQGSSLCQPQPRPPACFVLVRWHGAWWLLGLASREVRCCWLGDSSPPLPGDFLVYPEDFLFLHFDLAFWG